MVCWHLVECPAPPSTLSGGGECARGCKSRNPLYHSDSPTPTVVLTATHSTPSPNSQDPRYLGGTTSCKVSPSAFFSAASASTPPVSPKADYNGVTSNGVTSTAASRRRSAADPSPGARPPCRPKNPPSKQGPSTTLHSHKCPNSASQVVLRRLLAVPAAAQTIITLPSSDYPQRPLRHVLC